MTPGLNPGWNDCHIWTIPLGLGCSYDSFYFKCINTSMLTNWCELPSTHHLQASHLHMTEDCILRSQDLKYSRGACFAGHIVTRQLLSTDHEISGMGLESFSWMCTLQLHLPVIFTKTLPRWIFSIAQREKKVQSMHSCLHNGKQQYFLFSRNT